MDPTWIEIFKQLGLPVALLILVIWKGLPYLAKQFEDAKAERKAAAGELKAEREALAKRLEAQGQLFAETLEKQRKEDARRFDEAGKLFMEALRTQNVLAAETHSRIAEELRAINERLQKNGK